MYKGKFARQDDVMLDREIQRLQKQIAKLTEWHSDLSKRFFSNLDKILLRFEKIEQRLDVLEKKEF